MSRLNDLSQFYDVLTMLEHKVGGKRILENCDGHIIWPQHGIYFFFENGENRSQSGESLRIAHVGTHSLTYNSRTTLWKRLHQHQGTLINGGGNHRTSVFRRHVGAALLKRDSWSEEIRSTWGKGMSASREVRIIEDPIEKAVSQYLRRMPFLWLEVNDAPGPESLRGMIECNAIALLSNYNFTTNPMDPQSSTWLGHWADRETIRFSGLWNVNHVAGTYNPAFLGILEGLVAQIDF